MKYNEFFLVSVWSSKALKWLLFIMLSNRSISAFIGISTYFIGSIVILGVKVAAMSKFYELLNLLFLSLAMLSEDSMVDTQLLSTSASKFSSTFILVVFENLLPWLERSMLFDIER